MIREVPRAFEYECDICGVKHLQENAGGHYTDSRPDGWSRLLMKQSDSCGPFEWLCCELCSKELNLALDSFSSSISRVLP